MDYLDILSLADTKTYLRIDDTQNETDSEIKSMIKSALRYIENHTNHIFYARSKTYDIRDGCVRVYDHPINSVTKGIDDDGVDVTLTYKTNYTYTDKGFYRLYESIDGDAVKLVLNVGYTDGTDIPDDLIDLAKIIVKVMYYELETDQSFQEILPNWAKQMLAQNRRFLI